MEAGRSGQHGQFVLQVVAEEYRTVLGDVTVHHQILREKDVSVPPMRHSLVKKMLVLVNIFLLKENWYNCKGDNSVKIVLHSSEKGFPLKMKEVAPLGSNFNPFRVDQF